MPDLLFLLAGMREQLETAHADRAEATARLEAAEELERRLRDVVAALRDENDQRTSELEALRLHFQALGVRAATAEEEAHHQADAAKAAGLHAQSVARQIEDMRSSRTWRLAEPLRRGGTLFRSIARSGSRGR